MSDADSYNSSDVSEDSQPPREVNYPLNEETEVPDTDGGLFKTVLVEGNGTRPAKGAKATVHYVGKLEDGTQFDSSRDRDVPFEFDLGKGQVIKGWDKGVMTMKVGEKAILKCTPDYGYGPTGSPPKIPGNATLLFEVELLAWTRDQDISKKRDGSLIKNILHDGTGVENPAFESQMKIDLSVYIGAIDPHAPDTMPAPVFSKSGWEIVVGETEIPPMLEPCLVSLRANESAAFKIKSELIPDAAPAFHIPAAADRDNKEISYLVVVHSLLSVKSWEFEGEKKVEQGVLRKERGNAALKAGNYALAERYYRRALEFVGEDYGLKDEVKPACHEVRVAVSNNLAQVLLNQQKYGQVFEFTKKVLTLQPHNAKALFREAKARNALQDWDLAIKNCDTILEKEPENADAKALKATIAAEKKAYDQKQKSMFKKMFS
ncbi:FK506-binding protein 4/5 [Angomonas deanei]|uniref:peptidylprolyl isomerase n=1 Tax=Angomonas deanei TaxID=59799 RepID=S9WRS7_9TRYP|nr:FK506-binding protein 4/5 [Angomonas deanei]EPY38625.1 FK506-binding protein 4/5 [Angomonas deanei]CAD2217629.1 FKBP-type peptidyl-prolyl cis-trans isomerase, putative [Angomonas deanei]|eukprot:EPY27126.1 FK506-binding protein 4/5 [Angomonas deanei]